MKMLTAMPGAIAVGALSWTLVAAAPSPQFGAVVAEGAGAGEARYGSVRRDATRLLVAV
jgi:hypothetical protein